MQDYYTVRQYAEKVGMTPGWIYELVRQGKIKSTRPGGPRGAIRIPVSTLNDEHGGQGHGVSPAD